MPIAAVGASGEGGEWGWVWDPPVPLKEVWEEIPAGITGHFRGT